MKNPPHSGEMVREELLEPYGLSVTEAAKLLQVSRQTLNNLVNEKSGISAEMAMRLEKAFSGDAAFWLRLQASYDLAQIRKREKEFKIKRYQAV